MGHNMGRGVIRYTSYRTSLKSLATMFKTMTKKEYQQADKRLAEGIRQIEQACKLRDTMTYIMGNKK